MALRRTLVVTQFYGRIKGRHLHNRIHRCVCRHNIRYQNLSIAQWTPFVFLIQLYHGTNIFYRTGFALQLRNAVNFKGLFIAKKFCRFSDSWDSDILANIVFVIRYQNKFA